ncbi:MAG: hypothetical protein V4611_03530 [Patescibacteria group bacterium]
MNARSPEESSSHEPTERHVEGGASPSFEILDNILARPRMWLNYLEGLVTERYPLGGRDLTNKNVERVRNKKISQQLHLYDDDVSGENFAKSLDEFRRLAEIDPDVRPFNDAFTPHIINRHIISTLYRTFVSPQYPSPSELAIKAAQAQLAIESASILEYQQSLARADGKYLDKQLLDIDAMILHLGNVSFNNQKGIPGMAVIPNPHFDAVKPVRPTPEFLVFTPNEPLSPDVAESTTAGTLAKDAKPGAIAQELLANTVIHEIAHAPVFQKKGALGPLIVARQALQPDKKHPSSEDIT